MEDISICALLARWQVDLYEGRLRPLELEVAINQKLTEEQFRAVDGLQAECSDKLVGGRYKEYVDRYVFTFDEDAGTPWKLLVYLREQHLTFTLSLQLRSDYSG